MSIFEVVIDEPNNNVITVEAIERVIAQIDAAEGRPLLLTGAGRAFSAGVNLERVLEMDRAETRYFLEQLEVVTERLYTYPAPTVVAVNGHSIAGGCILALACDYRVATTHPKARIGLTELALGVAFPPGVFQLLRARLPSAHQDELMLGAGLHAPERALALGLVDALSDDPVAAGRERLELLSGYPSATYASTKAGMRTVSFAEAGSVPGAWEAVLDAWMSEEVRGRMRALLR
ncbi:MAG: enoyl-CoA hydratase/isomerase family protein [Myxococcota bacterium]|nr:enoyl-CoA hydratase/isomerase family protein [Myxococcota bacterium]MEE2780485.1 enoyl-CoA hydratase/isomerase family protein [Myxococcota bacterium]